MTDENVDYKQLNKKLKLEDQLGFLLQDCILEGKYAEGKMYNEPQVLVITPDWYFAIDLFKSVEKFDFSRRGYVIKPFKLFSKHMKPNEQVKALSKFHPKKSGSKLLNVYLGTPNRILKLLELDGIKLTSSLKYVVLHCKRNMKNFTIFDIKDTRKDLVDLMKKLKSHLETHPRTKMMMCP